MSLPPQAPRFAPEVQEQSIRINRKNIGVNQQQLFTTVSRGAVSNKSITAHGLAPAKRQVSFGAKMPRSQIASIKMTATMEPSQSAPLQDRDTTLQSKQNQDIFAQQAEAAGQQPLMRYQFEDEASFLKTIIDGRVQGVKQAPTSVSQTLSPDIQTLSQKMGRTDVDRKIGSQSDVKKLRNTMNYYERAMLELNAPSIKKEKMMPVGMSVNTSSNAAVPIFNINQGRHISTKLNENYMDEEFNDSPFDLNGSAVFWMW